MSDANEKQSMRLRATPNSSATCATNVLLPDGMKGKGLKLVVTARNKIYQSQEHRE
jgi:hypothetical protein